MRIRRRFAVAFVFAVLFAITADAAPRRAVTFMDSVMRFFGISTTGDG